MAFLTYGQSGDPQAEHFVDQSWRFARKEWRPVRFTEDAIAADVQRAYTAAGSRASDAAGAAGAPGGGQRR
jgi:hypothetical protein